MHYNRYVPKYAAPARKVAPGYDPDSVPGIKQKLRKAKALLKRNTADLETLESLIAEAEATQEQEEEKAGTTGGQEAQQEDTASESDVEGPSLESMREGAAALAENVELLTDVVARCQDELEEAKLKGDKELQAIKKLSKKARVAEGKLTELHDTVAEELSAGGLPLHARCGFLARFLMQQVLTGGALSTRRGMLLQLDKSKNNSEGDSSAHDDGIISVRSLQPAVLTGVGKGASKRVLHEDFVEALEILGISAESSDTDPRAAVLSAVQMRQVAGTLFPGFAPAEIDMFVERVVEAEEKKRREAGDDSGDTSSSVGGKGTKQQSGKGSGDSPVHHRGDGYDSDDYSFDESESEEQDESNRPIFSFLHFLQLAGSMAVDRNAEEVAASVASARKRAASRAGRGKTPAEAAAAAAAVKLHVFVVAQQETDDDGSAAENDDEASAKMAADGAAVAAAVAKLSGIPEKYVQWFGTKSAGNDPVNLQAEDEEGNQGAALQRIVVGVSKVALRKHLAEERDLLADKGFNASAQLLRRWTKRLEVLRARASSLRQKLDNKQRKREQRQLEEKELKALQATNPDALISEDEARRRNWKGSPSTFFSLSYSSTTNRHIVNEQEKAILGTDTVAKWKVPPLPKPSPAEKKRAAYMQARREGFRGSPSSYKELSFSASANKHIRNHQTYKEVQSDPELLPRKLRSLAKRRMKAEAVGPVERKRREAAAEKKAKREAERRNRPKVRLEKSFVGSPSSYRQLSFSSTANRHIHNDQELPRGMPEPLDPSLTERCLSAPDGYRRFKITNGKLKVSHGNNGRAPSTAPAAGTKKDKKAHKSGKASSAQLHRQNEKAALEAERQRQAKEKEEADAREAAAAERRAQKRKKKREAAAAAHAEQERELRRQRQALNETARSTFRKIQEWSREAKQSPLVVPERRQSKDGRGTGSIQSSSRRVSAGSLQSVFSLCELLRELLVGGRPVVPVALPKKKAAAEKALAAAVANGDAETHVVALGRIVGVPSLATGEPEVVTEEGSTTDDGTSATAELRAKAIAEICEVVRDMFVKMPSFPGARVVWNAAVLSAGATDLCTKMASLLAEDKNVNSADWWSNEDRSEGEDTSSRNAETSMVRHAVSRTKRELADFLAAPGGSNTLFWHFFKVRVAGLSCAATLKNIHLQTVCTMKVVSVHEPSSKSAGEKSRTLAGNAVSNSSDTENGSESVGGATVAVASASFDGTVEVWRRAGASKSRISHLATLTAKYEPNCVAVDTLDPEGNGGAATTVAVACVSRDGSRSVVRFYTVANGKGLPTNEMISTSSVVTCMVCVGAEVVTGDADGHVRVWTNRNAQDKKSKKKKKKSSLSTRAAASGNKWRCRAAIQAHTDGAVRSVVLLGGGRFVASAGADAVLKVWDISAVPAPPPQKNKSGDSGSDAGTAKSDGSSQLSPLDGQQDTSQQGCGGSSKGDGANSSKGSDTDSDSKRCVCTVGTGSAVRVLSAGAEATASAGLLTAALESGDVTVFRWSESVESEETEQIEGDTVSTIHRETLSYKLHQLQTLQSDSPATGLAFLPDSTLVSGHEDGCVRYWRGAKEVASVHPDSSGMVSCLTPAPDGSVFVGFDGGIIRAFS